MKKTSSLLLITLFILTACLRESADSSKPATATAAPSPTATATLLPTPASPNDSIQWVNLQVTLEQVEITGEYLTDYGSTRVPPTGQKFLWAHIHIKNTGQIDVDTPALEHYSVLYASTELKPTYGHRDAHTEYTTLDTTIFPNTELDGWLRFDIPETAELKDMRFVFIPESSHIGASFSSPTYPYAGDKPTYVWNCAL